MKTFEFSIEGFARACEPNSLQVQYNVDAADVLSCALLPEAVAALRDEKGEAVGLERGDRLVLSVGDEVVFSGVLAVDPAVSVTGGAASVAQLEFVSDWHWLEQTKYLQLNGRGEVIYPAVPEGARWGELAGFAHGVFSWAASWDGSPIESAFAVALDGAERVPVPEGNGMTSCAQLLQDGARWVPDAFFVQRYGGMPVVRLTIPENEGVLRLDAADGLLQQVSLRRRGDLVPPVCALVGGEHMVLPEGGDVRAPGAFVFAVPVADAADGVAGAAGAASSKMVVRGVALPERTEFEHNRREYVYSAVTEKSKVQRFIERFWPELKGLAVMCDAAAAVVDVVPGVELLEPDEDGEVNEADVPANYSEKPDEWGAGDGGAGVYVLTEGSFGASADGRKNVKGLRWCKAKVSMLVRMELDVLLGLPAELQVRALELLQSKFRLKDEDTKEWKTCIVGRLELDAVLVNRRLRKFDPATNGLCKDDPMYEAERSEELMGTDYKLALQRYYDGLKVGFEGSVGLLMADDMRPWEMAGCSLQVHGLREEWAAGAGVVRGVSWDVGRRVLSLSVGAERGMSFDEELQRLLLARMPRVLHEQRGVVPFDSKDDVAADDREATMSVSPSVSAGVSAVISTQYKKPFTLYTGLNDDGLGVVMLRGGTLSRGELKVVVPDSQFMIRDGVATSEPWSLAKDVVVKWVRVGTNWRVSVYQN